AVALAALAQRGELTLQDLARYREHVDSMSLFGKALYLQAATSVDGAEETVGDVLEIILQDSNRAAGTVAFNEVLDIGYERILATPLRSNCAILSALSRAQPSDAAGSIGELPSDLAR